MAAKKSDERRDSERRYRDQADNNSRGGKRPGGTSRPDRAPEPDAGAGTRKPRRGPRRDQDDAWEDAPAADERRTRKPKSRPETRSSDRPGRERNPRDRSKRGAESGPRRGVGQRPDRAKPPRSAGREAGPDERRAEPLDAAAVAVGVTAGRRVQTPALPKDGREFIYGRHAVLEMLRAGRRRVHNVWLGEGVQQTGIVAELLAAARLRGIPVKEMSRVGFERLGPVNHQGVVAEVEGYPYVELDELLRGELAEDALFLALDHLQDVQNLGTLLRTAEAMNVAGVILPERRAAEVTPAAVNASSGAVEHLQIAMVGNLVQALEQLKAAGVWIAGLDSGPGSMPLARADLSGRLALVVGGEGEGLARLVREKCDWLVAIPMYGKIGSLNAAVAGSVALVTARQAQRPRE